MPIEFITPNWPAPSNVRAISTCRSGGVSQGQYAGLNLAHHVGDSASAVKQNRQLLCESLQLSRQPVWLEQVHGTAVHEIDSPLKSMPQADASIVRKAGLCCAVMTADCVPILMCNRQGTMVAAVHAGWRGLLAGVVENTVLKMGEPTELMVWLGPAIGPDCFEVGAEVLQSFTGKHTAMSSAFKQKENGKYLANLYDLARVTIDQCGIKNIYGGEHCTYNEPDKFFSYRRNPVTGRMASLIWLQP